MLTRFENPPVAGEGLRALYVIDANSGWIEFSTVIPQSCGQWSPDGSAIYFIDEVRNHFQLTLATWRVEPVSTFPSNWSTEDRLMFFDGNAEMLRVEDADGNMLFEGMWPEGFGNYVEWNSNGDYALLFTLAEPLRGTVDEPFKLWLLSLPDQSVRLVSDRATTPVPCTYASCLNTLPVTLWAPTGDRAVFPTVDGPLMWLNVADLSTEETGLAVPSLVLDEDAKRAVGGAFWLPFQPMWGLQWSSDHGFFVLEDGVHVYDLGEDWFFDGVFGRLQNFGVSPDGRYLVQNGFCDGVLSEHGGHCIWDLQNGTAHSVMPTDTLGASSDVGQVNWHDTENWVLLADTFVLPRHVPMWSVANAEGTVHRGLSLLDPVNWLPDNVDTSHIPQSEPSTSAAQLTLTGHQAGIVDVAWSPDGSKIASIDMERGLRIWDTDTGENINTWTVEERPVRGLSGYYEMWYGLVWGADSQTLAVITNEGGSWERRTSSIQLWQTQTGEISAIYDDVQVLKFDEGHRYMLMSTYEGLPTVLDITTGEVVQGISNFNELASEMFSVADKPMCTWGDDVFSPDGRYYVGRGLMSMVVVDAMLDRGVLSIEGGGIAAAWSPDSTRIAVASGYLVRVWAVPGE